MFKTATYLTVLTATGCTMLSSPSGPESGSYQPPRKRITARDLIDGALLLESALAQARPMDACGERLVGPMHDFDVVQDLGTIRISNAETRRFALVDPEGTVHCVRAVRALRFKRSGYLRSSDASVHVHLRRGRWRVFASGMSPLPLEFERVSEPTATRLAEHQRIIKNRKVVLGALPVRHNLLRRWRGRAGKAYALRGPSTGGEPPCYWVFGRALPRPDGLLPSVYLRFSESRKPRPTDPRFLPVRSLGRSGVSAGWCDDGKGLFASIEAEPGTEVALEAYWYASQRNVRIHSVPTSRAWCVRCRRRYHQCRRAGRSNCANKFRACWRNANYRGKRCAREDK